MYNVDVCVCVYMCIAILKNEEYMFFPSRESDAGGRLFSIVGEDRLQGRCIKKVFQ